MSHDPLPDPAPGSQGACDATCLYHARRLLSRNDAATQSGTQAELAVRENTAVHKRHRLTQSASGCMLTARENTAEQISRVQQGEQGDEHQDGAEANHEHGREFDPRVLFLESGCKGVEERESEFAMVNGERHGFTGSAHGQKVEWRSLSRTKRMLVRL